MALNQERYPLPVRALFVAGMAAGIWCTTVGLHATIDVIARCDFSGERDIGASLGYWITVCAKWYLVARVWIELLGLAVFHIGTGRIIQKDNPAGVLRRLLGWELFAAFVVGMAITAKLQSCHQCTVGGVEGSSCSAEIDLRVMSMVVAIWVSRCLRITGQAFAPTRMWI
jgi:hypothetical protein